ncbi:pyridoxal-phosphate dependent enzyme [Undibacterium cyanobacteriorum]|uniref:Pyridoxal-phosphate dependent enzyme n=1 Tax=Undibacterium cyanobacteriorum TaxID=3073561 RepID=A0ABY9RGU4_9BURK|nr:pyridoxal-phosphate dependent enzyme [Undibacterium sp. 20NA77.5]WMW80452.1 pyridoxal-phosphate dependent enzyme [Undibacterium sp. 20NA77.5]
MTTNAPLEKISSDLFNERQIWVKRDDLLHPTISGNKYRKLEHALPRHQPGLVVSMGGPWSNHLHALAFACYERGWPSYGFVRGLRSEDTELTATLRDCQRWGMRLQFISRIDYKKLRDDPQYWQSLIPNNIANSLWLEEGGRGIDALRGLQELPFEIAQQLGATPDYLACACGTGTTLAGLALGARLTHQTSTKVLGISAVGEGNQLHQRIYDLLSLAGHAAIDNYQIRTEFDHGGFAKTTPKLIDFCERFTRDTKIPIEPVYTGKLFFALSQLCQVGYFSKTDRIVAIHTGGLQGARSKVQGKT